MRVKEGHVPSPTYSIAHPVTYLLLHAPYQVMEWFDQAEFKVWVAKLFGLKEQTQVT